MDNILLNDKKAWDDELRKRFVKVYKSEVKPKAFSERLRKCFSKSTNFSYELMGDDYEGQTPFMLSSDEVGLTFDDSCDRVGIFEIKSGSQSDYNLSEKDKKSDGAIYVDDIIKHLHDCKLIDDNQVNNYMDKYNRCLPGIYLIEHNEKTAHGDYKKLYKVDNTIADHGRTFINYGILNDIVKTDCETFTDDGFHYLCVSLIGHPTTDLEANDYESNRVVLVDPANLSFRPVYRAFSERIHKCFSKVIKNEN